MHCRFVALLCSKTGYLKRANEEVLVPLIAEILMEHRSFVTTFSIPDVLCSAHVHDGGRGILRWIWFSVLQGFYNPSQESLHSMVILISWNGATIMRDPVLPSIHSLRTRKTVEQCLTTMEPTGENDVRSVVTIKSELT